jgi:hypothetical protein
MACRSLDHRFVVGLGLRLLLGQNQVRVSRVASEEHDEIGLQLRQRLAADAKRLYADGAVDVEVHDGQTTEGGDVLVLLAHRSTETLDLDTQASRAKLSGVAKSRRHVVSARKRPTVKEPDVPRPVPDGISATLTISIPGGR